MKSLYRCENHHYSLNSQPCKICHGIMTNPYPARFSLIKERKYHSLLKTNPKN